MKEDSIVGLDIGSTEVRLVIGQRSEQNGGRLQIIGAISSPSEGINKGMVKSIDDTTSSVSSLLEKAERLIGLPISNVYVSVNDPYIKCEKSKGVVAVGKSNGEISQEDVERAIEAARTLSMPPNYEILHVIPIKFTVDNQEDIKDPIGMSGIRLEVEALIVQGMTSQIKNLTKAIYRTGLNIDDLVLSSLALGEAVLSAKQKDLGVAVAGIGASTTTLAVYEEGKLIHAAVIPIGSEHITSDIAIGLRCPINLAERVKIEFGSAVPKNFSGKEEVDISELAREEEVEDDLKTISKKYVAEIIEARAEEIFDRIDEQLKKIDRSGLLPAGIVLAGGGAKLAGLVEVAKDRLRLPASVGICRNAEIIFDKVNDSKYLTALGLVIWGNTFTAKRVGGGAMAGLSNFLDGANKKIKDIFSRFAP
ncbi:MAG TPA: cell division protein FtsA [Candidatus Nanoarchaeia archaeon]|nr:cell division protein FtsA [Candidatus Nanoarchaeia archaeon]